MGTVYVHDGRPDSSAAQVDEQGYGPLLSERHRRRRMEIGDLVTLPDGSSWPVVSSRQTFSALGWTQHVLAGARAVQPEPLCLDELYDLLAAPAS